MSGVSGVCPLSEGNATHWRGAGTDDRQWVPGTPGKLSSGQFSSGENGRQPEEISSVPASTNRKRAPQCGVATMFVAEQGFDSPMLHKRNNHPSRVVVFVCSGHMESDPLPKTMRLRIVGGSERPENCPVDSFQRRTGGSPGGYLIGGFRNIPDLTVFMDMSTEKVNNWGSLFLRKILDTDASGWFTVDILPARREKRVKRCRRCVFMRYFTQDGSRLIWRNNGRNADNPPGVRTA